MSSFNRNNDFRYKKYNYFIRPFNNKYFLYENKYLIRYEYYNIFMNYMRNKKIYDLNFLLNKINNSNNLLIQNNENNQNIDKTDNNKNEKVKNDNVDKKISHEKVKNDNDDKKISHEKGIKISHEKEKNLNKKRIQTSSSKNTNNTNVLKNSEENKPKYDYRKKSVQEYYIDHIKNNISDNNSLINNMNNNLKSEKNDNKIISGGNPSQIENHNNDLKHGKNNNKIISYGNSSQIENYNNEHFKNITDVKEEKIVTQDEIIVKIQEDLFKNIWNYTIKERLPFFSKMKHVRKFNYEHNYSVDVSLLENYVVRKILKYNSLGFVLFKSEVTALLKLNKYPYFPKILTFDPKRYIVYMSYCGEPLNYDNCPDNWYQQYSIIAEIMKKENTTSSDIIDRNICVLNNQIHIIDFGLANQFSESVDTSITKLYKILYKYGKNKKYIEYNL